MRINVASWNLAGAKLLDTLPQQGNRAADYVEAYGKAWDSQIGSYLGAVGAPPPHIILLQECIGFKDRTGTTPSSWPGGETILTGIFPGYECFFFPAFSSLSHPHPGKWSSAAQSGIDLAQVVVEQGYGMCVRTDFAGDEPESIRLRRLWATNGGDARDAEGLLCFQAIPTTTGLYAGNRDTEPRLAVLGRMDITQGGITRTVNIVNLHLTTLKQEREGIIAVNQRGSRYRLRQIESLFVDIISLYQSYQSPSRERLPESGPERQRELWIVGGDLNAAPDSDEVLAFRRAGFVDAHPLQGGQLGNMKRLVDASPGRVHDSQVGTKWAGKNQRSPPIAVDYVFCGLERSAFPQGGAQVVNSLRPYRPDFGTFSRYETDHAFLYGAFEV